MFDISIPVFPFDSTAITVTTTVWVGVMVSVFFNLRLGWTLSGLVVPGYLVPLLMTRPITAGVILLESALTYWIVWIISETPRRLPYWSSFFGRDRFFVILLVSVVVRSVLDGFALPWIGRIAVEDFGINFDYRNNLHSFGLIVVALIANYFWKPGIMRGLPPLATCVGFTYLIIQVVLIRFTNFNLGNFHLLYEDITSSLMASPKSYMLVLSTAYIASWMNLKYAWDFNGILIPALLGLLWHDPVKILISGGECVLLLLVGSYLIRTPVFRRLTIQGSRQIMFFFTICFVYRLLVCHLAPRFVADFNLTDAFGFGYLLSTLMAIKIHNRKKAIAMLFGTAKVSMLGAVAGSLIGFAFYCGPRINFSMANTTLMRTLQSQPEAILRTDAPLHHLLRADKTLLYEKRKAESYQRPMPAELTTFHNALTSIRDLKGNRNEDSLSEIAKQLHAINYRLAVVRDRYLYLREQSPANGWGMYVIDTHQLDGIRVQVPAPLDEWSTLESGICLFQQMHGATLAIAGSPRRVNFNGEADMTSGKDTMFKVFDEVFNLPNAMQVRGYTRSSYRQLCEAESRVPEEDEMITAQSRLYIRGAIPPQVKLTRLKDLAGSFEVRWNDSVIPNRLRDSSTGNFAELILNRRDRRRLVGRLAAGDSSEIVEDQFPIVRQSIGDWLSGIREGVMDQGSNAYVPSKVEQMLFMDQEVVAPLIELLSRSRIKKNSEQYHVPNPSSRDDQDGLTAADKRELQSIHSAASAQGYGISVIVDEDTNETFVALSETGVSYARGWGTYVFRPQLLDSFAVEVPRPLFERRSFEFGVNLFERPRGSALLIAGAHPRANLDGSADISKAANRTNLFNLVRHVLLRRLGDRPFLITQARAIQAPVKADVVVATDDGATTIDQLTPLKKQLLSQLDEDRLSFTFVDGGKQTAGYELGIMMQAASVQISRNKEVVSLWLSPSLRTKFREQDENYSLKAQFVACGIDCIDTKLTEYMHGFARARPTEPLPNRLRNDLTKYILSSDVVLLNSIADEYTSWNFSQLVDTSSGQAFLCISSHEDRHPAVLNLSGAIGDRTVVTRGYDADQVRSYIRSRALWLEPYEEQVATFEAESEVQL